MTDKIDDGGPAFPRSGSGHVRGERDGMSLRDWFAGQVLPSLMDADVPANAEPHLVLRSIAGLAYDMADAMLAARAKGGAQ